MKKTLLTVLAVATLGAGNVQAQENISLTFNRVEPAYAKKIEITVDGKTCTLNKEELQTCTIKVPTGRHSVNLISYSIFGKNGGEYKKFFNFDSDATFIATNRPKDTGKWGNLGLVALLVAEAVDHQTNKSETESDNNDVTLILK